MGLAGSVAFRNRLRTRTDQILRLRIVDQPVHRSGHQSESGTRHSKEIMITESIFIFFQICGFLYTFDVVNGIEME